MKSTLSKHLYLHYLMIVPICLLYACGGDGSPTLAVEITMPRAVIQIPVVSAGSGTSVGCLGTMTIDGNGSNDGDNALLTRLWLQSSGPAAAPSGTSTATSTFVAPDYASVFIFNLIVSGNISDREIGKVLFIIKCLQVPITQPNINHDGVDKLFVTVPYAGKMFTVPYAISTAIPRMVSCWA